MKYLQRYKELEKFREVYYDDEKYFEPWLSFTDEVEKVDYNRNMGGDYLTFEILSSGTIYLGELLLEKLRNYLFTDTYSDMNFTPIEDLPYDSFINMYDEGILKSPRRASSGITFKNFYDKFNNLPPVKYKLNDDDWVDWQIDEENYYRELDVTAGDIIKFKGDFSYPAITYENYNFDNAENGGSSARYATFTGNIISQNVSIDLIHNMKQLNLDFDLKFIEISPIDVSDINIEFIQYYLLNKESFYTEDRYSGFNSTKT